MKTTLRKGWAGLHLTLIVLVNAVGTYNLLHKEPTVTPTALNQLLNQPALRYYGRFTGAEHGFGFFGLNVRSNGILVGESHGRVMPLVVQSFETLLRLFSLGNSITDELLQVKTTQTTLQVDYRTLTLRNIAHTLYRQYADPDTGLTLSYSLLHYPSLAEHRAGKPGQYTLNRFLTARYTLNHHADLHSAEH